MVYTKALFLGQRLLEVGPALKTSVVVQRTSVLVGGQMYSAVGWFHGRANPPPKLCRRIQDSCTAVELKGGDLRTLVRSGYASERPKELLQQGSKLCSQWRQTDITGLLVRSAGVELGVSLRQALFLEADLRKMPN